VFLVQPCGVSGPVCCAPAATFLLRCMTMRWRVCCGHRLAVQASYTVGLSCFLHGGIERHERFDRGLDFGAAALLIQPAPLRQWTTDVLACRRSLHGALGVVVGSTWFVGAGHELGRIVGLRCLLFMFTCWCWWVSLSPCGSGAGCVWRLLHVAGHQMLQHLVCWG